MGLLDRLVGQWRGRPAIDVDIGATGSPDDGGVNLVVGRPDEMPPVIAALVEAEVPHEAVSWIWRATPGRPAPNEAGLLGFLGGGCWWHQLVSYGCSMI